MVLVGLLVSAGLVFGVTQVVPLDHEATGRVVLLPPPGEQGSNPYLDLQGLGPMVDVVSRAIGSPDTQREVLGAKPAGAEYTIAADTGTNGPILVVTVTDADPARTLKILSQVLDQIPRTLTTVQDEANVPAASRVTSIPVAVDTRTEPQRKSQLRMMLVAGAGGLVLTAAVVALVDALARRRRED